MQVIESLGRTSWVQLWLFRATIIAISSSIYNLRNNNSVTRLFCDRNYSLPAVTLSPNRQHMDYWIAALYTKRRHEKTVPAMYPTYLISLLYEYATRQCFSTICARNYTSCRCYTAELSGLSLFSSTNPTVTETVNKIENTQSSFYNQEHQIFPTLLPAWWWFKSHDTSDTSRVYAGSALASRLGEAAAIRENSKINL